jgi:4-hydroxy 2-oxovalerate aldolase
MREINILDCTLRDGSYAINYSFTSADTSIICRELESAGVKYIEIGHGVGLNGSNAGYGTAMQTDEEYMIAAKNALSKAKFGMFCIPGIANLADIDLAKRHGMGFIRVGTNVTQVAESEEFIKKAKKAGMFVAANFMKSYAMEPEQFAETVKLSESFGADMVYIVDSSGGMFPEQIRKYFKAIRKISDIPLGFHGHDNIGLAQINSIESVEMGIQFIDTSLQGLGRSSGNAATELVVAALMKKGYSLGIDFLKIMEIGQKFIQPLLPNKGRMPLDIVSGYADFHSSYMKHIQKYSAKYQVDPSILIIELCKIDKVNLDEKLLDRIAQKLKKDKDYSIAKYGFYKYFGGEQERK